MIILGAGMAGCIAAIANPDARVIEAGVEPELNHQALLRFRDESVSRATGVPFRRVVVHKSIWFHRTEVLPSPRFTHMYAKKVSGVYSDRSISNIESGERYVAPHDFHQQMLDRIGDRIRYGQRVIAITEKAIVCAKSVIERIPGEPIVSTLPIYLNAKFCGLESMVPKNIATTLGIRISQYEIEKCDAFATVYFPDHAKHMYRASITGDRLICESVGLINAEKFEATQALGMYPCKYSTLFEDRDQAAGKIVPLPSDDRRGILFEMTSRMNLFSLLYFLAEHD